MIKKEPIYGRSGPVEGNDINSYIAFEIWTADGDDLLEDGFNCKGKFGLYQDNDQETDMAIFVSNDEDEVRKLADEFIEADREYAENHKAKPKPLTLLEVSHDLTYEEKANLLINHRKDIIEERKKSKK